MKPSEFTDILEEQGIDFFSGVPDSLLANLCAYISNGKPVKKHVIAVNEGAAMAIAAGFHLATGRMACVYMQNSGQGNAVNPLCSLFDKEVYSIPVLMVVGWRGQPGHKDEPQHVKQGKVTVELNETLGVPTYVVGQGDLALDKRAIKELIKQAKKTSSPVALVIPKGFFEKEGISTYTTDHQLIREDVIERIISTFETAAFVSTTGKISRELHDLREKSMQTHEKDFLTVGSMGHASSIALGIAMAKPERIVLCVDGDGAVLMHMGSLAVNACRGTKNL